MMLSTANKSVNSLKSLTAKKRYICACSDIRKKHEVNISNRIKENVNQLLVIGTVDFKLMYEIAKDMDAFHKEKFEELKRKYQSTSNTAINIEKSIFVQDNENDDSVNIFIDNDKN